MAFPVAIQSAVFYILACTPCMAARGRYRTRKQTRRDRDERARRDEEEPDAYRHPSALNTNPYWEEDIRMGPSLPKKSKGGANGKSTSQRKLTSSGKDSSSVTQSSLAISHHRSGSVPDGGVARGGVGGGGTNGAMIMRTTSMTDSRGLKSLGPLEILDDAQSISMLEAVSPNTLSSEGWNYRLYQREDEELWGEQSRTHKLMDAIVKAGSSAGRLLESTLGKERPITDEDRANFYYGPTVVAPPVNEYHPPVVSNKPVHKDALRWMLQPPPPAKVMEGKVPVSRSTSIASSARSSRKGGRKGGKTGSEVSLPRRMALEARLRKVESNTSATTQRPLTPSGSIMATPVASPVASPMARTMSAMSTMSMNVMSEKDATATRARSQRSQQSRRINAGSLRRMRNRSDSSSDEATDCSSGDEDNRLRTEWRTQSHTRRQPRAAGSDESDADDETVPKRTLSTRSRGTHSPKTTAAQSKLRSIPSSDAVVTKAVPKLRRKEDMRLDELKLEHPRSASSSLDSGLAMA